MFAWAEGAGRVEQIDALVGIPLGDHRDVPAGALLFEAALQLPVPASLPGPLRRFALAGGRHARLRHVGAYEGLEDATDALLGGWWPGSGTRLRDAPIHYRFLDDPEQVSESGLRADILLPLDD